MRSSIRKVWGLPEYPGTLVVRLLIDLLVLVGLGFLLAASLATAFVTVVVANRLVERVGADVMWGRWLATVDFAAGVAREYAAVDRCAAWTATVAYVARAASSYRR